MKYYVYLYLRKDLYSPYYVGKGKDNRCYVVCPHRNTKPPKDKDRIRKVFHTDSEAEALLVERTLIRFYGRKCEGGILMNIQEGGKGGNTRQGIRHTEETKKKMSASRMGTMWSEKTRQKQSIVQSGKIQTEEKKAKCSIAGKKAKGIPKPKGKNSKFSKPCIIDGVRYDSQTIAAEALGVSSATISRKVNRP